VAPNPAEEAAASDARAGATLGRPTEMLRRPARFADVSALVFGGLWSTPSSVNAGASFDPALGVRLCGEIGRAWGAELIVAKGGSSGGNPYASTSTSRLLFGGHGGYWLFERDRIAVQAGAGILAALSSTHYSVRDVGGDPQAVDSSSALTLAPEASATLRVRPLRFVELRLDAGTLYRDGRLELLLTLGAGAWVAF
jgi:hypothetical protein